MLREEAKKYMKSKMCSDCGVYIGGGKCLDSCKVIEAIKALEQESVLADIISEIEEAQNFVFITNEEYEGLRTALAIINKY